MDNTTDESQHVRDLEVLRLDEAYGQCNLILESCFQAAEVAHANNDPSSFEKSVGDENIVEAVNAIAESPRAAKGVLLTLVLYKAYKPEQDVRCNKSGVLGGFSGRQIDSKVTVPFLNQKSLDTSVESHWLSQTYSYQDECWTRDIKLNTSPKWLGPKLIDVINRVEEAPKDKQQSLARAMVSLILYHLIDRRNRNKVLLTRPKNLTIKEIMAVLHSHFERGYEKNAPRLPQLAVYAVYECLVDSVSRYAGLRLEPLGRMKAADRKAKTVGDIVLTRDGRPIEAVETKLDKQIGVAEVTDAMAKIKTAAVERYFILSTSDVSDVDRVDVDRLCNKFRESNGCEIIANGLYPSINYYLRMLPAPTDFIDKYATLVEEDIDLDYQHRVAWNEILEARNRP